MLKLGIIGLGHWGPNYVRCFLSIDEVNISVVCDRDSSALSRIKKIHPFLETTSNYKDVLNNASLDAVVVATPASTHFDLGLKALEAGKHVLIEKPLCLKLPQASRLVKQAASKNKILMVAYTFLYNPAVRKLKELVERGELGEIYYLHATRTNLGPVRSDVNALWDLAPHDLSIFYYLLGCWPQEVSATGGVYLQKNTEDVVAVSLRYRDGATGHIHASWLDPRKVRQITVIGSKKMALFDDLDPVSPVKIYDKGVMKTRFEKAYASYEEFKILTRDAGVMAPKVAEEEPLKVQCSHFVECLKSNAQPLTNGQVGFEMLYVLNALTKSLKKNGQPIKIVPQRKMSSAVLSS